MTLNELRIRRALVALGEMQIKLNALVGDKPDAPISIITKGDIKFLRGKIDDVSTSLEEMMR